MTPSEIPLRFGSPAYVYDLAVVRQAYADLTRELPDCANLFYSLKANPHPRLVAEISRLGGSAEVSSPGELLAALAAGVSPERCLYSAPGKTAAAIRDAVGRQVTLFSVESASELDKLSATARSVNRPVLALIRVNPDHIAASAGLAMTGTPSQFGVDESWLDASPASFAGDEWAKVVGIHCYFGTNLASLGDLIAVFSASIETASRLSARLGIALDWLDLGGGFYHPYAVAGDRIRYHGLKVALECVLDRHLPRWRRGQPHLIFESGRYLAGGSGTLFGTVLDAKSSKGRHFAILDFGINHFGGMAGLRRIPRMAVTVQTAAPHRASRPTTLTGPLCTPLDVIASNVMLPPLAPGDLVSIPNVGAYGLTASLLPFLSHPPPLEAVLDGDRLVELSQLKLTREEKCPS